MRSSLSHSSPVRPRTRAHALALLALSSCTGGAQMTGDARLGDASDDVAQDVAPEAAYFDLGPSPACDEPNTARHVMDRPGGDRVGEPGAMVPAADGFLVALRRTDNAAPLPDGTLPPPTRDSVELVSLGPDGAPRGQRSAYDARPAGTQSDTPLLFAREGGAFLLFQESRSNATAADFLLQLRGAAVDPMGMGDAPAVLRERYPRPSMAALGDGTLLGLASRFVAVTAGGTVTTEPVALRLRTDGTNAGPDVSVNAFVPYDLFDPVLRASDDGGARYVYRTNNRLGFLRFRPDGAVDARGPVVARGSEVTRLDDAVSAGDGIVAVGSRVSGRTAEVRVTVTSDAGELRLARVLETSSLDEGSPAPTAYRAYGGAVLLWTRGAGAMARVRVAVVAPDGRVLLEPRDLVSSADSYGRVIAVVRGRSVSLLVRDGVVPARWGYSFARACVPSF